MRILITLFFLFLYCIDAVAQKPVQPFTKKTSPSLINKLSINSDDSITVSIRVNHLANFLKTKKIIFTNSIDRTGKDSDSKNKSEKFKWFISIGTC